MILYTCRSSGAPGHPCAKATKALDDAGHRYEIRQVKGALFQPWTWLTRARDRAEVQQLSGQRGVPIIVLDDSHVIAGSSNIVRWAKEHAPQTVAPSLDG